MLQTNGMGLDFRLGLWRFHTMAIQVEGTWEFMAKGLDFGLGLSRLHTMPPIIAFFFRLPLLQLAIMGIVLPL
jgi:hypothetical protein